MYDAEHTDRLLNSNIELNTMKQHSKQVQRLCVLAILVIAVSAAAFSYWVLNQGARNASCRNDVFVLREYLRKYAANHEGLLPPISPTRGNLMIDPKGFYPEHLENSCWLQCEWSDARRRGRHGKNDDLGLSGFNDDSFCYLPWAIANETEGLAFIEAYKSLDLNTQPKNLTVHIDGGERVLSRIRFSDAVLEKTVETAQSGPPIVVEWPDKFHTNGTVLFADGRIVTMKMGEDFPMTEKFIAALREIASIDRPLSTR